MKVRGYVTRIKKWTFKWYSLSTRLHLNTHNSFFFYLNTIGFRNTSIATHDVAWQPLPVILVLRHTSFICFFRGLFSVFWVLMYSAEWTLVWYVYIFYIFTVIFLYQAFNRFATTIFDVNDDAFERYKIK